MGYRSPYIARGRGQGCGSLIERQVLRRLLGALTLFGEADLASEHVLLHTPEGCLGMGVSGLTRVCKLVEEAHAKVARRELAHALA